MSEIDDDKVPTTVKQDLVLLDGVFDSTNTSRDAIARKLETTIADIQLSKDDPKLLNAQMKLVDTYLGVLSGKEANIARRVSSKLKQVEAEATSKHSSAVADLLNKISVKNVNLNLGENQTFNQSEMDRQIEQAFEESGLDPILATELKVDPNDLRE